MAEDAGRRQATVKTLQRQVIGDRMALCGSTGALVRILKEEQQIPVGRPQVNVSPPQIANRGCAAEDLHFGCSQTNAQVEVM